MHVYIHACVCVCMCMCHTHSHITLAYSPLTLTDSHTCVTLTPTHSPPLAVVAGRLEALGAPGEQDLAFGRITDADQSRVCVRLGYEQADLDGCAAALDERDARGVQGAEVRSREQNNLEEISFVVGESNVPVSAWP